MGRKKVTMELIGSRSIRGVTYKKRKASLFKKASELATLCDIEVCLAVSRGSDDLEPEVWPSLEVMTQMVSQANGHSEGKQTKTLEKQIAEMKPQLQHLVEGNLDLQAKIILQEALYGSSSVAQVASPKIAMILSAMVDGRMKKVQNRIDSISISSVKAPFSPAPAMVHAPLIGPQIGECVVSETEQSMVWKGQGIAGSSDPTSVASLPDGCVVEEMPGLLDVPHHTEEFFNGLPSEIAYSTEWLGADWEGIYDVDLESILVCQLPVTLINNKKLPANLA